MSRPGVRVSSPALQPLSRDLRFLQPEPSWDNASDMTAGDATESMKDTGIRRLGIVPAFDGVRGVAVLLTVAYHFRHLLDPWTTHYVRRAKVTHLVGGGIQFSEHPVGAGAAAAPDPLLRAAIPSGGFLGVDVFFVLSGFLITALLLREQATRGRISFPGFYRRRALRLLPALFLFVAAQIVYAVITHVNFAAERDAVVALLFYFWNWRLFFTYPAVPRGIAHLWSLSVEEQFYLVWPLAVALFFGVRRRASSVITAMIACIAAVVLWRFVLTDGGRLILLYFRTDVRADELVVARWPRTCGCGGWFLRDVCSCRWRGSHSCS